MTDTQTTQSKVQHTPGPWTAMNVSEINRISNHWIIQANSPHVGGKSQTICEMNGPWKAGNYAANAHLIAAAPDGHRILSALAGWLNEGAMPKRSSLMPDSEIETFAEAIHAYLMKARGQ